MAANWCSEMIRRASSSALMDPRVRVFVRQASRSFLKKGSMFSMNCSGRNP
jgi:hypothetical protein